MKINTRLIKLLLIVSFLPSCALDPEPLEPEEYLSEINSTFQGLFTGQQPLMGTLTLSESIARALKYNYDYRLANMQAVLRDTELGLASYAMLPAMTASAGYVHRTHELASSSESILTRTQSLEPSTSLDNDRMVADLNLSWNILDFGTSYFQAKQQADRFLIAQEQRRKVVNIIVKDVLSAYWSASISDAMIPRLQLILTASHLSRHKNKN